MNPIVFFDQADYLSEIESYVADNCNLQNQPQLTTDIKIAANFLICYQGSPDTFNAYRREIERLLQWCCFP